MYKIDNDEKKILDQVDIVEFISRYVDLKKAGSNYKALSPFKEENTASFIVSPSKKIFTCFSSNISGDLIHFYKTFKNITRKQAVYEIAKEYGIILSKKKPINIYTKILEDASIFFANNLSKDERAIKYLENRNHNIKDLKRFSIGYAKNDWESLSKYLIEKYKEEHLIELGLSIKSEKTSKLIDMFRDRIMFPIFNNNLDIVGFGGRYIGDDKNQPKYINSIESKIFDKSKNLYGLFDRGQSIKNNKYAILVEGFLDVISLHKNGFDSTLASLGTAFSENHARLLSSFTNSVILIFDNDEAGKKATLNTIKILNKYEFNIKCLSLPNDVKDPDEYFRKYNQDDFLNLIKNNSIDGFEYVYKNETLDLNLNSASSKRELIERLKPYFQSIKNEIVYNFNLEKLSKLLSLEINILKENFKIKKNKEIKKGINDLKINNKKDIIESLEWITLKYLVSDKKMDVYSYNMLKNLDFSSEKYSELNKKLKSVEYNILSNDLEFSNLEDEIVADLILSEHIEINEFTYISLIRDWLVDVYIKKIEKNINEMPIKEKIVFKNELYILKDKIKNTNNILEMQELFKKIKILEGVKYGN